MRFEFKRLPKGPNYGLFDTSTQTWVENYVLDKTIAELVDGSVVCTIKNGEDCNKKLVRITDAGIVVVKEETDEEKIVPDDIGCDLVPSRLKHLLVEYVKPAKNKPKSFYNDYYWDYVGFVDVITGKSLPLMPIEFASKRFLLFTDNIKELISALKWVDAKYITNQFFKAYYDMHIQMEEEIKQELAGDDKKLKEFEKDCKKLWAVLKAKNEKYNKLLEHKNKQQVKNKSNDKNISEEEQNITDDANVGA